MNDFIYFKICFLFFAVTCFIQRILEIKRHRKKEGVVKARWTLVAMTVTHLFFFAGSIFEFFYLNRVPNLPIIVVGIFLFSSGLLLRRWVIATLGQLWSVDIEIRKDHELITTGPYAFCRHPNYLAILFEVIGFCLMAHAYATLGISLAAYSIILFLRIKFEESSMIRKFPRAYVLYKRKTAALLPFLI